MNKHSYNLFNLWSTLLNLISFNCLNQTLQETDHDQKDNTAVCFQNINDEQNITNTANNEEKEASVLTQRRNQGCRIIILGFKKKLIKKQKKNKKKIKLSNKIKIKKI
ncbi:hypothetical protein GVAV_001768 [Gurleya vavrai]